MATTLDTLHGPPEIGGVLMPEADFDTPVEGFDDHSESVVKVLDDGTKRVVRDRRRRRWRVGWKDLSEAEYQALVDVLDARSGIEWKPRTVNEVKGDASGATVPAYTVRLVSERLPRTRKLNVDRFDPVDIELEEETWFS